MKASELLREARKIIEQEDHWTQGSYAQAVREPKLATIGNARPVMADDATCFCSMGALYRAAHVNNFQEIEEEVWAARAVLDQAAVAADPSSMSIIGFNDKHTHDEVLAVFDEAITNLEAVAE